MKNKEYTHCNHAGSAIEATIIIPVSDLRRKPVCYDFSLVKDANQESQLLYGERIKVCDEKDGWVFVEAVEQPKLSSTHEWTGYSGWVQSSHLCLAPWTQKMQLCVQYPWISLGGLKVSMGTCLNGTKKNNHTWLIDCYDGSQQEISDHLLTEINKTHLNASKRNRMITLAIEHFLGDPYFWGGRSAYDSKNKEQKTGLDCSGLVNLLYRAQGVLIPRDAKDQLKQCKRIEFKDLKKADLIFLSQIEEPENISHVMLYLEEDLFLEATMDSGDIRIFSGKQKLGKMLKNIRSGEFLDQYVVTFGTIDL